MKGSASAPARELLLLLVVHMDLEHSYFLSAASSHLPVNTSRPRHTAMFAMVGIWKGNTTRESDCKD